MSNRSLTSEQVLTLLAEVPRLAALTAGVEPAQLRTRPNPNEWSANEVLAHLGSCADVWGNYIPLILAEERPMIRAVSPRTWIERTEYPDLEFAPSLDSFTMQRANLLAVLEALLPKGWSRAATVLAVGRKYERTVLDFADRLIRHERPHVTQIERIVTTQQIDI